VPQQIRPGVQRILDALTAPALVSNARMDYLAANRLGRALYAPLFDSPVGTNAARFLLLDPRGPRGQPTGARQPCRERATRTRRRGGSPDPTKPTNTLWSVCIKRSR
jgi:hypothetical protein